MFLTWPYCCLIVIQEGLTPPPTFLKMYDKFINAYSSHNGQDNTMDMKVVTDGKIRWCWAFRCRDLIVGFPRNRRNWCCDNFDLPHKCSFYCT